MSPLLPQLVYGFEAICEPPALSGVGSFSTNHGAYFGELFSEKMRVVSRDLDQDGDQDLVVLGISGAVDPEQDLMPVQGKILINAGGGKFYDANGEDPYSVDSSDVLFADFDQNGHVDIFIADKGASDLGGSGIQNSLMLQYEWGWINSSDRIDFDLEGKTTSAAVYDIDSDGDLDIFVYNNGGGGADNLRYWLINDGNAFFNMSTFGRFEKGSLMPPSIPLFGGYSAQWDTSLVLLEDLDGDGHLDFLVGGSAESGNQSRIYWGGPEGFLEDRKTLLSMLEPLNRLSARSLSVTSMITFDVNRDGQLDLFVAGVDDTKLKSFSQLWMGAGDRNFLDQTDGRLGARAVSLEGPVPADYVWFDLNQDGHADIVPQNYIVISEKNTFAWLGDSSGYFKGLTDNDMDLFGLELGEVGTFVQEPDRSYAINFFILGNELGASTVTIVPPGSLTISPCPISPSLPIIPTIEVGLLERLRDLP